MWDVLYHIPIKLYQSVTSFIHSGNFRLSFNADQNMHLYANSIFYWKPTEDKTIFGTKNYGGNKVAF